MTIHNKTLYNTIGLKMAFSLMLTPFLAMAADDSSSPANAGAAQTHCEAGKQGCPPIAGMGDQRDASSVRIHQNECAQGSQDCDTRGQSMRSQAEYASRDRHAGRD
jgi:hypothetical protein